MQREISGQIPREYPDFDILHTESREVFYALRNHFRRIPAIADRGTDRQGSRMASHDIARDREGYRPQCACLRILQVKPVTARIDDQLRFFEVAHTGQQGGHARTTDHAA